MLKMTKENGVRFMSDNTKESSRFVYRPPDVEISLNSEAQNATLCVKFSQRRFIIDEYWIIGDTKWSRFKLRLKHSIVYSKRGLKKLFHKIKRVFVKSNRFQSFIK